MQFERGKDPKSVLNIGECRKRLFKDFEEAAQWFAKYPAEYTEGQISDWLPYCNRETGNINSEILPSNCGKLQQVKWVKFNIRMANNPDYDLGLKESKGIVDRAWEIIRTRVIMEGVKPVELDQIIAFIEDIERKDSALRNISKGISNYEGWDNACYYIKQFVEGLRS